MAGRASASGPQAAQLSKEKSAAASQSDFDAVVVLQMGGPSRLRDVRPFLANLFSDRDIIRFPARWAWAQPLFAQSMSTLRTPLVWPRYRAMGGGSPLNRITKEQAEGLGHRLSLPVHVAMRYTAPDAREVCKRLEQDRARRVLLVPLYPHWSHTTTGSSLRDFARTVQGSGLDVDVEVVPAWGDDEGYAQLVAAQCNDALEGFAGPDDPPVHLLLSAHSLPIRYIEQGDPYQRQVEDTLERVRPLLEDRFASVNLGYQSRVGPVDWIGPETDDVLEGLAKDGAQALLLAPFGFVSDHIETRFDMDRKYRKQAKRAGIRKYGRVPSLNTDPRFIDLLERLTMEAPRRPLDEVIG